MNTQTRSTTGSRRFRDSARVVWAIAWKDILESLKNKNTLAVLLTSLPMILVYYYLPTLGTSGEPPRVRVYDAGESVLVARLENSDAFDLRTYPTEDKMKDALRSGDVPEFGLVIPDDFDAALEAGGDAQLQGYLLSWVDRADTVELQRLIENEVAAQLGQPVPIVVQDDRVVPEADSTGFGITAGLAMVFVIVLIGLTLIPHLMLEEKTTRTLDVLLVSPASAMQLVFAKSIAGVFYCLLAAGLALAVFNFMIIHWWLAVLSVVLGSLFAVSVGLFLGQIIESRGQLTMWAWVVILPLFLPMMLSLMEPLVPEVLIPILRVIPSVALINLIRTSLAGTIPWGTTLVNLGLLVGWTIPGLLALRWTLKRQDEKVQRLAVIGSVFSSITRLGRQDTSQESDVSNADDFDTVTQIESALRATDPAHPRGERNGWRILWAIAAKDIGATLKNKLALSIILGTSMIMVSNVFLPLLLRARNEPAMVVYDPGRSAILRALSASDDLRLGITDSVEEMEEVISSSPELIIGLVVPEDFDRWAGSSELIQLDGYVVHWADDEVVAERVAFFEQQLGLSTWGQVQIQIDSERLYPQAEPQGQIVMFAMVFTMVISTMGVALVPLLLVEERQAHTFEVLLLSPARITEVVGGKALAGIFYVLLAAVVVFLFNRYLVVHWGVAIMAVLLGAVFTVAIGLLVGIVADNPTSVGLWGVLILVILLGSAFLTLYSSVDWSPTFEALRASLPTTALIQMLAFSTAGRLPLGELWLNAARIAAATLLVFGLLIWRVRLSERH